MTPRHKFEISQISVMVHFSPPKRGTLLRHETARPRFFEFSRRYIPEFRRITRRQSFTEAALGTKYCAVGNFELESRAGMQILTSTGCVEGQLSRLRNNTIAFSITGSKSKDKRREVTSSRTPCYRLARCAQARLAARGGGTVFL